MSLSRFLFGKNAADVAMPYYQQASQGYSPYMQQGQQAGKEVSDLYHGMTSDPTGHLNSMLGQYQESPEYQRKLQEALRAAGNSAAAGGMRGSYQDMQGAAGIASSMADEDMQNWLKNVLGIEQFGAEGQSHISDMGYNAQNQYANALMNQGNLAYGGQQQQNANRSKLVNSLMRGAGAVLGSWY